MAHILIIEDDEQVRTMVRKMLERAGYETVEAPDGKVATGIYRRTPPDLIVTDIIMPEREGLEIITELRREHPNIKIIAISGGGRVSGVDYLDLAKKLGADRTLAKPFHQEELLDAVRTLLGEAAD